jgi:hypothetical protein
MSPFQTPGQRPPLLDRRATLITLLAIVALLTALVIGVTQPSATGREPAPTAAPDPVR